MRSSVELIRETVLGVVPHDEMEAEHLARTSAWLQSTDDVFRRSPPAKPSPHLVTYSALTDPEDGRIFLVFHREAQRWLPPGGHVEADEQPADAAARELEEELHIEPVFATPTRAPSFLTVSETVGPGRHTDVTLWFVFRASKAVAMRLATDEFEAARWWGSSELRTDASRPRDPHHDRFLAKLAQTHQHG